MLIIGKLTKVTSCQKLGTFSWKPSSAVIVTTRCLWCRTPTLSRIHTQPCIMTLNFYHFPCHCLLSHIINIPIAWRKWPCPYCILRMVNCVISFLLNWASHNCFPVKRCHNKVWQLQSAVLPPVPRKHLPCQWRLQRIGGSWIAFSCYCGQPR